MHFINKQAWGLSRIAQKMPTGMLGLQTPNHAFGRQTPFNHYQTILFPVPPCDSSLPVVDSVGSVQVPPERPGERGSLRARRAPLLADGPRRGHGHHLLQGVRRLAPLPHRGLRPAPAPAQPGAVMADRAGGHLLHGLPRAPA